MESVFEVEMRGMKIIYTTVWDLVLGIESEVEDLHFNEETLTITIKPIKMSSEDLENMPEFDGF
jgi:hypothetical protein